jgi:hypothetical protein
MKSKGLFVLAGFAILLLVLGACGPNKSTCPSASLQAPVIDLPTMWEVEDSLQPLLQWSYPDKTCDPQSYNVVLMTGPLFTDKLGGNTGSTNPLWSPTALLKPGKEYAWGVQAASGTTLGPIAGYSYFFTGPMCSASAFKAPVLLQPAKNGVVTSLDPNFLWRYPDPCLPQGYRIDLSAKQNFTGPSLGGLTNMPSSRWGAGAPLADCTTYYWRVAPLTGGTSGPLSPVFSFKTNTKGTCPAPTPEAALASPAAPTFTFTFTPASTSTSTPTPPPLTFTPKFNAYCRFGPDLVFDSIELAMKGIPYLMDGRNLENTWYRIMVTPAKGCWVPRSAGTSSGDTSTLRVLADVPTPVPTPVVNCSIYTTALTCSAQPVCVWVPAFTHAGDCVHK